jgi:large subunit ribosomal protein L22
MEAIAKAKYLKGSPRKARLVIDLIRGRNVSQALAILKFTNKRAAEPIAKCLNSAIANATYLAEQKNIAVDPDDLWVKTCFVDMGPTKHRRRMRPAPQGRAYREQRHYCHITIEVTSDAPVKKENDKPRKEGKKLTAKKAQAEEKKTQAKVTNGAPEVEAENVGIEENQAQEVSTKTEKTKTAKKETKAEAAETKTAETDVTEQATETEQPEEAKTEQFENQEARNEADAADVKDATSQTPAEKNEPKRADEKQLDVNDQLERQ